MFMDRFFSRSLSDLFTEFVDRVRMAVSPGNRRPQQMEETQPPAAEEMKPAVVERLEAPTPKDPEMWFIKLVEDGLRKFPDFIRLGQSPLADCIGVKGENHIARGKRLHQVLHDAIESLRPAGVRPASAPPRNWYNYIVLHDAYVTGMRNCDVRARLYISEGTFNRTRRNAVRGVALWLIEGQRRGTMSIECAFPAGCHEAGNMAVFGS
jgi:hypothetical protein